MRIRTVRRITLGRSPLAALLVAAMLLGAAAAAQERRPTFRSGRDLVSVDVVVRDRNGEIVRDLTADDFEVREDGRVQQVLGLSFQEISETAVAPATTAELLPGVEERMADPAAAAPGPMRAADVAGRRLLCSSSI
jgi:hypothetical protein